jgi:hypothetical protein
MAIGDLLKGLEELTGVAPGVSTPRKMTRKEKQEQAARVKRFLALPPELQEGLLKYGENIREAYSKKT